MNLHWINKHHPNFKNELIQFESQFHYPFGVNQSFSITHGDDYCAFFRSMGEAYCLMAESQRTIHGTFCCSLRQIDNNHQRENQQVAYLGDLKITPIKQNTTLFYRLAKAMFDKIKEKTNIAIAIVMDGTKKTPSHYSGRLGLPLFHPLDQYVILRFNTAFASTTDTATSVEEKLGHSIFHNITNKYYFQFPTNNERSKTEPIWLTDLSHTVCGKLEDTAQAKRLIADDGTEIRAAHLSYFAFNNSKSAYHLLLEAINRSKDKGFTFLFIALTAKEYGHLTPYLNALQYDLATATLYCNQKYLDFPIHINTAEI